MSLEGKVCIVTGASSGIGEAIAVLFAERKASIVLCGRSESRLERSLQRCQEVSGNKDRFVSVLGDLTDRDVRTKTIQTAIDVFGRIDVLIANAGIFRTTAILKLTEEMHNEVMNVNSNSVFFLIKDTIPWLEKTQGNVVCISSIVGHVPTSTVSYNMSKASVDHLCRCLAIDLGPKGIRVNVVSPTFVETRIFRDGFPPLTGSEYEDVVEPIFKTTGTFHPLHQRNATSQEVARATAFLASDEASFVTGQNLCVDGGLSLTCKAF